MFIINDLYYCGRGDVDKFIDDWSESVYFKIMACRRLELIFRKRLEDLDGGGPIGCKKFLTSCRQSK